MTLDALNDATSPFATEGDILVVSPTVPVKPLRLVSVTLDVEENPWPMLSVVGVALIPKSMKVTPAWPLA